MAPRRATARKAYPGHGGVAAAPCGSVGVVARPADGWPVADVVTVPWGQKRVIDPIYT